MLERNFLYSFTFYLTLFFQWTPCWGVPKPQEVLRSSDSKKELIFSNSAFERLLIEHYPKLSDDISCLKIIANGDFENTRRTASNLEEGINKSLYELNTAWEIGVAKGSNFLQLYRKYSCFDNDSFYTDEIGTYSRLSFAFSSMDDTIIPAISMAISRVFSEQSLLHLWQEVSSNIYKNYVPSIELRVYFPQEEEVDKILTVAAKLKLKPEKEKPKNKTNLKVKVHRNLKVPLAVGLFFMQGSVASLNPLRNYFSRNRERKAINIDPDGFRSDFSMDDPFDVHLVRGEHFFEPQSEILNTGTVMASNALVKSNDAKSGILLKRFKPHSIKKSDYFAFMRRAYLVPGVEAKNFRRELISQKDWIEATNSNLQYTGNTEDGFTVAKQIPFLDEVQTSVKVCSFQGNEVDSYQNLFPSSMRPQLDNIIELVDSNEPVIEGSISIAQHYNLPNKGVLIVVDSIASLGVNKKDVGWLKRKILTGIPESVRLYEFTKETKYMYRNFNN
ncbi:MAG: hypothetical protein AB8G05_16650 [Oligoflexales bacterium]